MSSTFLLLDSSQWYSPRHSRQLSHIEIKSKLSYARFKHRILHAPNQIAKLSACKMRRLNQLNVTYFNLMRVSRICD